jgi:hypothetical protein
VQPVRRSSSERSTIQYVDEDAPTPRRIARGSLAAGKLATRFEKANEPSTVRVDPASLVPLLERAKSSTTEMRPLFDRDDETTRPLEYDGVTLPRDLLELCATDVQPAPRPSTRTTGKHVIARPHHDALEGVAPPSPVGPFATVGSESTVTGELAYDLLALVVPRTSARMERVEAPIDAPMVTAPVAVPTVGRRSWMLRLLLLVTIAALAFGITIAAAHLGLASSDDGTTTRIELQASPTLVHERARAEVAVFAHEPHGIASPIAIQPRGLALPAPGRAGHRQPARVIRLR